MSAPDAPGPGARVSVGIAGSTAEVLFNSLKPGDGPSGYFARVAGSIGRFEKGSGAALKHIGFQVVNFNDFFTPGVGPPRPLAFRRMWRTCSTPDGASA